MRRRTLARRAWDWSGRDLSFWFMALGCTALLALIAYVLVVG